MKKSSDAARETRGGEVSERAAWAVCQEGLRRCWSGSVCLVSAIGGLGGARQGGCRGAERTGRRKSGAGLLEAVWPAETPGASMESQTCVEGLLPVKTEPATSHKETCTDTESDALVCAR